MKEPLTIQCDKHGTQPFHYLCVHLADGSSDEWIEVDTGNDGREVESDFACPVCKPLVDGDCFDAANNGRLMCMGCVRDARNPT